MRRASLGILVALFTLSANVAFSQSDTTTLVTAEEIEKVVSAPATGGGGGGDRPVKIVDLGKYNVAIAVLRRGATKPGATVGAINHTKVTEVYYVVSGSGTLVTGGEVTGIKPIPADSQLVTTVVGPGSQATFVRPGQSQKLKTGDVVIIPAGVYHGFSEVPDHIEYVSVRPDVEKVLPGGYVSPFLK